MIKNACSDCAVVSQVSLGLDLSEKKKLCPKCPRSEMS